MAKPDKKEFSQQDLVLPVNGIPLTVTRTYNSLNLHSGDFGYGWTYALSDMDVAIDEQRQEWQMSSGPIPVDLDDSGTDSGSSPVLSVRTGGGWDVTLTLPDGRRTTFQASFSFDGYNYTPQWQAAPGVNYTLQTGDGSFYSGILGCWNGVGGAAFNNYDISSYVLIDNNSGTQYYLTRGQARTFNFDPNGDGGYVIAQVCGPPMLTKVVQRSLDKILIGNSGVTNYDPSGNMTRSITFDRDPQGRITAAYDPNAGASGFPAVKYVYDSNGNLVQVKKLVDRNAATYTTDSFSYANASFPHYITGITNADGAQVARQLYDGSGRLIGIIDAAGKTNLFVYDLNAHTETVYDQLNNPTINFFDSQGNVTNTVDALGRHTARTFDANGSVTSVTGPLTNTYHFTYDANGNQTSVVDPLGHTNLAGYDGNGQLVATTNALGAATRFQYDNRGNQTNTVDALNNSYGVAYDANSRPTVVTDPLNRTNATATYDLMGNLASLTDKSSGTTTSFAYDANGNQTMSSNLWVNPTNSSDKRVVASQSVYDAQGREISSTDPDGLQSSVTYDPAGRQSQLVDEYNRTSGWVYDPRGSLVQISFPDGSISRMVYDDVGRLSVTDDKHLPGAIANGSRTTYDAVGQVIVSERLTNVVIDISGGGGISSSTVTSIGGVISTSTYGYDLAGRQIAVTNGFGNVTRYEYDAAGNQTAVIDALNNRTDNVYDPAGRLIFTTNALHQVTQYVYDALGRSVRTIYPDGSFTAVAYDAVGNRVAETNQLGLVTTYLYDSASRMTNLLKPVVFNPEGGTNANPQWNFAFDANGQLKSVSDPKLRTTSFTYDQLGRTLTHTLPMGQMGSQLYDSFGRTFRKIDFKGQTNEFLYDSTGKVSTNRFYAAGSSVATNAVTYVYDSQDRTTQIVEPRGTNAFTYDAQGHLMQIASPEGAVNYEYEPIEGRRVRTYTANSDLRYTYDELGRVKTVTVIKRDGATLATPEVTTNNYTALGSLQDVYYPNGIHAAYQYDGLMNRLTNLVYTSGSTLLAQYVYAPNTNGQWKTATEIQLKVGGGYCTNQLGWFYDNLGRLTNETCGSSLSALNYTNRYVYNLVGNRLWATNIAGGVTTVVGYTYNTNDQLITDGSFTNWYDANGSVTNRSSLSEQNAYFYNLQNRLATAIISRTDSGQSLSETANFTYDYHGNRVRSAWTRNVGGNGTNIFLYEPNSPVGMSQVLEELPAIGATPSVSYTLGTRIMSQGKGGTISHFLPDGHGSARQLADASASITARFTYDAYGKGLDFTNNTQSATATALLYSGGRSDPDLLQYSLGARYYNPTLGRFNQIDPYSANQSSGANLYAYGADDPVNNSDPSGMYEIDVHEYLTRFLAEKVGFGNAIDIGRETQALDEDGRDAMASLWLPKDWENMSRYHFVNKDRLKELASKADPSNLQTVGEFLHAQEDTFAHCSGIGKRDWHYYGNLGIFSGGFPLGHVCSGHAPDHTWHDVDKAMMMGRRVYEDLKILKGGNYPNPKVALDNPAWDDSTDPKWSQIRGTVWNFAYYNPEEHPGEMFSGPGEIMTQLGYLNKIRMLYPGYTPDFKGADKNLAHWGIGKPSSGIHASSYNVGSMDMSSVIGE